MKLEDMGIKVNAEITEMEKTIERAKKLGEILKEAKEIISEISKTNIELNFKTSVTGEVDERQ